MKRVGQSVASIPLLGYNELASKGVGELSALLSKIENVRMSKRVKRSDNPQSAYMQLTFYADSIRFHLEKKSKQELTA